MGSTLSVSGSMSSNRTAAPTYRAQFALATNDSVEVATTSPGPSWAAAQAACNAAVPFENATAYSASTRPANASSNSAT